MSKEVQSYNDLAQDQRSFEASFKDPAKNNSEIKPDVEPHMVLEKLGFTKKKFEDLPDSIKYFLQNSSPDALSFGLVRNRDDEKVWDDSRQSILSNSDDSVVYLFVHRSNDKLLHLDTYQWSRVERTPEGSFVVNKKHEDANISEVITQVGWHEIMNRDNIEGQEWDPAGRKLRNVHLREVRKKVDSKKGLVPSSTGNEMSKKDVEGIQAETKNLALLVKLHGGEPLSPDEEQQKKELKIKIRFKLRNLRSFLQGSPEFADYLDENREKEITAEHFAAISALPDVQAKVKNNPEFPFEFLNPTSPWFYILKRKGIKTLGQLAGDMYNNWEDRIIL